jgi:riboflavin kinase
MKKGKMVSSTKKISRLTGLSQQSISRKLIELENKKLISRISSPKGIELKVTSKGKKLIHSVKTKLDKIYSNAKSIISGKLVSGLGEGKYYVCQKNYFKGLQKLVGFTPFCGTLNLEVKENEIDALLLGLTPLKIPEFTSKNRSFGSIECFKAKIEGKIPGAVVFPKRTIQPKNIIELIAPYNLRRKLKLKNGSRVEFELVLSEQE